MMPDKVVLDFSSVKLAKLRTALDELFDARNKKALIPEISGTGFILELLDKAVKELKEGK